MIETLYLAKPRGFCAGVVMAIQAVEEAAREARQRGEGDIAVYHDIVHNRTVVERLEDEHSVTFVEDLDDLETARAQAEAEGRTLGSTVVFSAHGVSPVVRQRAAELRLTTIDATCPLVTKVHNEAKRYAAQGYHILLVGDSTRHQEVIGTRGEAPEQTTVVSVVGNRKHDPDLADPRTVTVPDPSKVVVLTQTTLSVDDTMRTVALLKERFPELVVPPSDDLCFATKNRQDAVRQIAPHVDVFLVVTSAASSNGMRLLELARKYDFYVISTSWEYQDSTWLVADPAIRREVMEIAAVVPSLGDDFTTEPVFVRERLGRPLQWTGVVPTRFASRADRTLPEGVSVRDLFDRYPAVIGT